jgi:hypothetical protein
MFGDLGQGRRQSLRQMCTEIYNEHTYRYLHLRMSPCVGAVSSQS